MAPMKLPLIVMTDWNSPSFLSAARNPSVVSFFDESHPMKMLIRINSPISVKVRKSAIFVPSLLD